MQELKMSLLLESVYLLKGITKSRWIILLIRK